MAAFDTTRPHMNSGSNARLSGFVAQLIGAFAEWNDARLTRKGLSALTDRELADIGLIRADIEQVTRR